MKLLRRLPFLALAVLGVWLWQNGSLWPKERELIWELGGLRERASGLEIQLYDGEGELLKRESWSFGPRPPGQVAQAVSLRAGAYPATVLLLLPDGGTESRHPVLQVMEREAIVVPLDRAPARR